MHNTYVCGTVFARGEFEIVLNSSGRIMVSLNLDFIAGSSKHGNASLASVGSKSVDAKLKYKKFKF